MIAYFDPFMSYALRDTCSVIWGSVFKVVVYCNIAIWDGCLLFWDESAVFVVIWLEELKTWIWKGGIEISLGKEADFASLCLDGQNGIKEGGKRVTGDLLDTEDYDVKG